jgi:hypothetical protein
MRILLKWAKNLDLVDEKLERLIMEDCNKVNMYVKNRDIDLEHYYKAKIMQAMVFLSAMPNTAEYRQVNKGGEDSHLEKYLLVTKWVDKDDGIDLSLFVMPNGRDSRDNFMVWWGDEDDLKYIVDTINADYESESERRDAYLFIIKRLAEGKNVYIKKRNKENNEKG